MQFLTFIEKKLLLKNKRKNNGSEKNVKKSTKLQ